MLKITNFIGGKSCPPVGGKYLTSYDPSTGEINALIPDSDEQDVQAAVDAASLAFPAWSTSSRAYRSALLLRVAQLLDERLEDFAQAESQDQGKPIALARCVDIPRAALNFRYFATSILHATEICSEIDGAAFSYVLRSPVGVAGLISPWNLPLYLLTWKIAPALAYGCTCVCKPSEITSLTAWMLCDVLQQAGIPPGVVNMCFGNGPRCGSAIVSHPAIPLISFTGGTKTGEIVYRTCSALNKKISLELGGKNANIIFEDANFDEAVNTSVRSSFSNQGEICLCGSRIFVHESLFERFVQALKERAEKLVVGPPLDSQTDMGALVSEEHLQKVLSYVDISRSEGGVVVTGGERLPKNGYWMRPTIITGLHPVNSRLQREEIFGPIVTITPFKSEDEVIAFANDSIYGLSASVWTTHVKRAQRVARQIKAGTIWINCWMVRELNMPFGGMKASGIGREGGHSSAEFFCDEKVLTHELLGELAPLKSSKTHRTKVAELNPGMAPSGPRSACVLALPSTTLSTASNSPFSLDQLTSGWWEEAYILLHRAMSAALDRELQWREENLSKRGDDKVNAILTYLSPHYKPVLVVVTAGAEESASFVLTDICANPTASFHQMNGFIGGLYFLIAHIIHRELDIENGETSLFLDAEITIEGWCSYDVWREVDGPCLGTKALLNRIASDRDSLDLPPLAWVEVDTKNKNSKMKLEKGVLDALMAHAPIELPTARAKMGYQRVALGGTFDHLHFGHKVLLTMAIWISTNSVFCGVMELDQERLLRKRDPEFLQSLNTRIANVNAFVHTVNRRVRFNVMPLYDDFGPTVSSGQSIGAIVGSTETLPGCQAINNVRAGKGLSPLDIYIVRVISSDRTDLSTKEELATKISSTSIRSLIHKRFDELKMTGWGRG